MQIITKDLFQFHIPLNNTTHYYVFCNNLLIGQSSTGKCHSMSSTFLKECSYDSLKAFIIIISELFTVL